MQKLSTPLVYQVSYGGLFFLILLTTVGLYWQGLNGIFILDDIPNLESLTSIKGEGINAIFLFALEGIASSLGRPISLLTFALQADNWPHHPWDFKYVNLMIHLLNGCLVFWFILSLTRLMKLSEKRSLLLAFLTASLWLLHPLQVSTVLYVIQRMTQLSTLFTLVGLLVYLHGRQHLAQDRLKSGFFWVSIGVVLGGVLGTLSKENGVLLVLYIIVLEVTLLRSLPKPRYWRLWSGIFLYLPLVLLALYFLTHINTLLQGYEIRNFTLGERLLTEARILTDYISKILLLTPYEFGLYHDDYTISRHLLTPPSTLIAIIFIMVMFVTALWKRHIWPVFALGVLWFLAGHVLESSFIGLMLYFEHRNYLAMLGIIFSIIYGAIWLFEYILTPNLRKASIYLSSLFFALLLFITWSETDLWGKPLEQTVFWAEQHPQSPMAQTHAVAFFQRIGENAEAEKYVRHILETFPERTAPYLYLIELSCLYEPVKLPDMQQVIQHFRTSKYDHATISLLEFILKQRAEGRCHLDSSTMDKMLNTLIQNPNNAPYKASFYYQYVMFHVFEKRYEQAVQVAKKALALRDSLSLRLRLIGWLILDDQFDEAKAAVEEFRAEINPIKVHLYEKQLKLLEKKIEVTQELRKMGFQIKEER